jgi:hypothetical protein
MLHLMLVIVAQKAPARQQAQAFHSIAAAIASCITRSAQMQLLLSAAGLPLSAACPAHFAQSACDFW